MKIDIKTKTIEMPIKITVEGIKYPLTVRNVGAVVEYWETKDEKVLEKLSTMELEF